MRNLFYLLSILFAFPSLGSAQIKITGNVSDQDNRGLRDTRLTVTQATFMIDNIFTDEKGNFHFHVPSPGIYKIAFTCLNFNPHRIVLPISTDTIINVTLESKPIELSEVLINRKKPIIDRKADRMVINIDPKNNIDENIIEVLESVPGLRVSGNNISLGGRSGFQIMVNGHLLKMDKDDLINYLRSMRASSISKIEIIKNPPSSYESEGNSGLINIIIKKGTKGWNSSLTSSYKQSTYAEKSLSSSFNCNSGSVSIYAGLNYITGAIMPVQKTAISYPDTRWEETNNEKSHSKSFSPLIGISIPFNRYISSELQYSGNYNAPFTENNDRVKILHPTLNKTDSLINSTSTNSRTGNFTSLNWSGTFTPDSSKNHIIIGFDYVSHKADNNQRYFSEHLTESNLNTPSKTSFYQNINDQRTQNYAGRIDAELNYEKTSISFGGKISYTKTSSLMSGYNSPLTNASVANVKNIFDYTEKTQALYISASVKQSNKWSWKLGLRMEATQLDGLSSSLAMGNQQDYIKIFPTAYALYNINNANQISFAYGKRIGRPPFRWLDPFRWHNNTYSYIEGNVALQPSFTDNINITHTYKEKFTSEIYYNRSKNGFGYLTVLNDQSFIQQTKPLNYFDSHSLGISESYNTSITKRWRSYNGIELYYSEARSFVDITNRKQNAFNCSVSTTNSFDLDKEGIKQIRLNYWYNFAGNIGLNKNKAYQNLDVTVRFFLFKKKGSLSVTGTDIFKSRNLVQTSFINSIQKQFQNYEDYRSLRFSFSYYLGNRNLKVNKAKTGNDDEKDRIK